jgi:hypothetical protein
LVITQIALAFLIIISNNKFILVILNYKPIISNIKTILFGLDELLTALTVIYKILFLLIYLFLSFFLGSYVYSIIVCDIALLVLYYYKP